MHQQSSVKIKSESVLATQTQTQMLTLIGMNLQMKMNQSAGKKKSCFQILGLSRNLLQSVVVMCYLWLCRWWCVRVLRRLLTLLWSLRNSRDRGACRPPGPILCPCSLITQSRFKPLKTTKDKEPCKPFNCEAKIQAPAKIAWHSLEKHCMKHCDLSEKQGKKQQQDDKVSPA